MHTPITILGLKQIVTLLVTITMSEVTLQTAAIALKAHVKISFRIMLYYIKLSITS